MLKQSHLPKNTSHQPAQFTLGLITKYINATNKKRRKNYSHSFIFSVAFIFSFYSSIANATPHETSRLSYTSVTAPLYIVNGKTYNYQRSDQKTIQRQFTALSDHDMRDIDGQQSLENLSSLQKTLSNSPVHSDTQILLNSLAKINSQDTDNLMELLNLISPLNPFFDADISISGVEYNDGESFGFSIQDDGSYKINLPKYIKEIRLDDLRLKGQNNSSFGSFVFQKINMGNSTISFVVN